MKWNGTVSHSGTSTIATRLATANAPQTMSGHHCRSGQAERSTRDAIALTPHGQDRLHPELRAQAADVDVDDVGAGVEVVSPDGREQPLLGDGLPLVLHQLAQEQELAVGEGHGTGAA